MEKTITLNETQMKLLQEYKEASSAEKALWGAIKEAGDSNDEAAYKEACRKYGEASTAQDTAARVFALSVAAVV
jgi:hypothetical protein